MTGSIGLYSGFLHLATRGHLRRLPVNGSSSAWESHLRCGRESGRSKRDRSRCSARETLDVCNRWCAAALSGIISTIRVSSVSPVQGQGLELQAIAACVIGGISLYGGKGSMIGVFLGGRCSTQCNILLLLRAPGFYLTLSLAQLYLSRPR